MLDFRIGTFLEVCRQMHFTRAAERLGLTQPAVSQHIRQLEERYGVELFVYQGKRLRLTPAGERLRTAAAAMYHDAQALRQSLREAEGREHLVFGATLTVGEFALPGPLARYIQAHPATSLRMVVANTQQLLRQVDEGELDFALVEGFFEQSEYECLPYSTERYLPLCAPGYPFPHPPRRLQDLLGERLITREPGSGTREVLEKVLQIQNRSVQDFADLVEIGSLGCIKALAAACCGITFLYEAAARQELASGALQVIPLRDFAVTHDFTLLWRKGSIFAPRYRALFAALTRYAGEHGQAGPAAPQRRADAD